MILLHRRDRLGNCLFQYAFARVLAERFAYKLSAVPLPGFPGTSEIVSGEEVFGPVAGWHCQWPFDALVSRPIKEEELFLAPGARLILSGWFQRFELIADSRELIRENWLRLDSPLPSRPSGDFVICIRLGDYMRFKSSGDESIPDSLANSVYREEEIRRLVARVPHNRLFLVTDQPTHPMFESLRDLLPEIVSTGPFEDFRFIHSFQKIAISQSTFHWWAAFLGRAREIYFPPCDRGIWSKPNRAHSAGDPLHYGIDVRVDEDRYIYDWYN